MSQKRDREENTAKSHKVPKLNIEELRHREYEKDLEYWKYNILPSWEELKEKQDNSVPWDMNDMDAIMKELDSRQLHRALNN